MEKYLLLTLGGKQYRFLIDTELDKTLKQTLKDDYVFDNNNYLSVNMNDKFSSYNQNLNIIKAIVTEINTYDLNIEFKEKVDSISTSLSNSKENVLESDLIRLENLLTESIELYAKIKTNVPKKNVKEIKENEPSTPNDSYFYDSKEYQNTIDDFREIINEASTEDDFSIVSLEEINKELNRIIVCETKEDYDSLAGPNYNLNEAINDKNKNIILAPETKTIDVVTSIINTCLKNDYISSKLNNYVSKKAEYRSKVNKSFEKFITNIKVHTVNNHNLNYYGDELIREINNICKETNISIDTMFKDYFSSYSKKQNNNNPMAKFINDFTTINGGGEESRAMLEALLVQKALSNNLISNRYNAYLRHDYQNLNLKDNTINFDIVGSKSKGMGEIETSQPNLNSHISSLNTKESQELEVNSNNLSYNEDLTFMNKNKLATPQNKTIGGTTTNQENIASSYHAVAQTPTNNLNNNSKNTPNIQGTNTSTNTNMENETTQSENDNLTSNDTNNMGSVTSRRNNTYKRNVSLSGKMSNSSEINLNMEGSTVSKGHSLRNNHMINRAGYNAYTSSEYSEEDIDSTNPLDMPSTSNDDEIKNNDINNKENINNSKKDAIPSTPLNNIKDGIDDAAEDFVKDKLKKTIIAWITKHPIVLVFGGILIILILILMLIFMAGTNENDYLGYYDDLCNFNDSKVTILKCDGTTELEVDNMDDYIVKMAYQYTKNGTYNNETIKALMIVLKTNTLSLGSYNSSNKEVNINICDLYPEYNDEEWNFTESDLTKLNTTYSSISEYLYISSSYQSAITSLSRESALTLNQEILNTFQDLSPKTYEEILETVYNSHNDTDNKEEKIYRDSLFIGDSRTKGMLNTLVINESNTVYGVGYGYNWLVGSSSYSGDTNAKNGAINEANSKMRNNASYNIVLWLGVNDLGSINSYISKYIDLASNEWRNHNLYVVSVGPVDSTKSTSVSNDNINDFNNKMRDAISNSGLSNLFYIDLNYNIEVYDNEGIHYSNNDYKKIYQEINNYLQNDLNQDLALYKMSEYCTYFTLTANDAYWWPIGSKNPTNGNIYGGDPATVAITARWYYPSGGFHGALDIGAVRGTPVIATKDGTVTFVKKGITREGVKADSHGNHVKIDHGGGMIVIYAHLKDVVVNEGDIVKQGQLIGYSGNTGNSTGPHLHFGMRLNGTQVNPLDYVDPDNPRPVNISSDAVLSPAENKSMVCSALLKNNYSKNAVAAILLNVKAEGSFKTNNLEGCYEENQCCKTKSGDDYGFCMHPEIKGFGSDEKYTSGVDNGTYPREKFANDRAGYGLIQWTSSNRKYRLYDYAKKERKSIASLSVQFGYLLMEIEEHPVTYKYLTGNYSAYEMASVFCKDFERPSGSTTNLNTKDSCTNRASGVNSMLEYVNNGCQD